MKKIRIAFEKPGYNTGYLITHPWKIIIHYWDELVDCVERGLYGYARRDYWGLNWYLSTWLPSALRMFKKGAGYPGLGRANTFEKWQALLEEMAKGFEADKKIADFDYKKPGELEKLVAVQQKGLKLFIKWYDNLWD